MLTRLLCLARGGHTWQAATDGAGTVVWCTRCGRQRHSRPVLADIHHRSHVNLAYEVTLRESPSAEPPPDEGQSESHDLSVTRIDRST